MNSQPNEMSPLKKTLILGLTIFFAIPTSLLVSYVAYQTAKPFGLGGWAALLVAFIIIVSLMIYAFKWINPHATT